MRVNRVGTGTFYCRLAKWTGSTIIAGNPCPGDGTVTRGGVNTGVGWAGTRKGTARLAGQKSTSGSLTAGGDRSPAAVTFEGTVLHVAAGTRPPVVVSSGLRPAGFWLAPYSQAWQVTDSLADPGRYPRHRTL